MDSKELALACMELADNRKAENIVVLGVQGLTSVTDYFVICSGTSEPHLKAIISEIREKVFEKYHVRPNCRDGMVGTSWVALDYFDVIVHVMRADTREMYNLEALWGDAPKWTMENRQELAGAAESEPEVKKPAKKAVRKTAAKKAPAKKTSATGKRCASKTTAKKTTTRKTTTARKTKSAGKKSAGTDEA